MHRKVTGALKLFHDKYKGDGLTHYMEEFEEAAKGNEELAKFLPKVLPKLNINRHVLGISVVCLMS